MLRIAVVDDEKVYIDQIQEYIRQYGQEKDREIQKKIRMSCLFLLQIWRSMRSMVTMWGRWIMCGNQLIIIQKADSLW